jgi:RNA polymerase sigma-70 factor (sigma-E family)
MKPSRPTGAPAPPRRGGRPDGIPAEGVDEALAALFLVHGRGLVGLARLLVDDLATAEDVVQDAFAATYRRWSAIRTPEAALPYLRVAVVNHARKRIRDRQHGGRVVGELPDRADSRRTDSFDALEQRHVVLAALRALSYRQRQVVVLRYYLDLSEAQVADQLGLTRGAVHRHAARATDALRDLLEDPEVGR